MRLQMIMGVTALALGVAFAAVPANAAGPGTSSGKMMHKHHPVTGKPLYNTTRQQKMGGSMGQQPATTTGAAPGRSPNDGGPIK
jgi:hypothetical protein